MPFYHTRFFLESMVLLRYFRSKLQDYVFREQGEHVASSVLTQVLVLVGTTRSREAHSSLSGDFNHRLPLLYTIESGQAVSSWSVGSI
jgi:hypothetical protein